TPRHRPLPSTRLFRSDGRVLATAHTRCEVDGDPTAHAEMLAIRDAAARLGDLRLVGCTLVVTLEPCTMCAGAIVLARLERLVLRSEERTSELQSREKL